MTLDPILLDIFAKVDAQMKAAREKKPPGDRRRIQGQPPEGQQERRTTPDRRNRARSKQ